MHLLARTGVGGTLGGGAAAGMGRGGARVRALARAAQGRKLLQARQNPASAWGDDHRLRAAVCCVWRTRMR